MSSIITEAGEILFAQKAQANQPLDIDTFIFANVIGQDENEEISRIEEVPTNFIVHQQAVEQSGKINSNVVVYSTSLGSNTGPFEFNWMGLYSSVNDTLVAINHLATVTKTATVTGEAGNTLNRNFGIEYSGIANIAQITVAPETWQLDFTERLAGMDELNRNLAIDLHGEYSFINTGFNVVAGDTTDSFKVLPGIAYVKGLRIELETEVVLSADSYPKNIYVDAYFDSDASSAWSTKYSLNITDQELNDYIDANGINHYVFKLAVVTSANAVEDLRIQSSAGNSTVGITLNAKDWGAKGDGVTDDTAALTAFINHVKATRNIVAHIPAGNYLYSSLPNLVTPTTDSAEANVNIKYIGDGAGITNLIHTGTGIAVEIDAYKDQAAPAKKYIENITFKGFSIKSELGTIGLSIRGIARSKIKDIHINGLANGGTDTGIGWKYGPSGTIGFYFQSIQLSDLKDLYTSYVYGDVPYRGVFFVQGNNGENAAGACSNNTFTNLYNEGNAIGMQMAFHGASQNTFISGSQEACFNWGAIVGGFCQFNTFINVGWENLNATGGCIQSEGRFTRYIDCYSSNLIRLNGEGEKIDGGIFERIEVQALATSATVEDAKVNYWNTGNGGFINLGKSTRTRNIYDEDLGTHIYPVAARITLPAATGSPYRYTNELQKRVKVNVLGGTVTKVGIHSRGGLDYREVPKPSAGFGTVVGDYDLDPGDKIEVSYSAVPSFTQAEYQY